MIELYGNDNQIMCDAIDSILVKIHAYKKRTNAKSILLTGCGAQAGTTTISINLAIALAMAGWKTLLVDCDLRKGGRYKRVGEMQECGLTEYLSGESEYTDCIYETNYENLKYLPNGKECKSPVRMICSAKMEKLVAGLTLDYDYIIYDMPSINTVADATILFPQVDGVALVVGIRKNTRRQVYDARRKIAQTEAKYLGMIVNNVDEGQYKRYVRDYDYFSSKNMEKRNMERMKRTAKKKGDKNVKKK